MAYVMLESKVVPIQGKRDADKAHSVSDKSHWPATPSKRNESPSCDKVSVQESNLNKAASSITSKYHGFPVNRH